jgi:hypothetical protein
MTKLGNLWTDAVAYVSLLVGAGLSVAGNLADTYRTRGAEVDGLDKTMAAAWPILVLLAVHMFVNPRWSERAMFQIWRWAGCLGVGGMAMVVSWYHLHDLMASRDQLPIVTVLGPLAIDGMAIMATGLILSTRVRGQVATPVSLADMVTSVTFTPDTSADKRMADKIAGLADTPVTMSGRFDDGRGRWADLVTPDTDADNGRTEHTPPGWTGPVASADDVATSEAAFRGQQEAPFLAVPSADTAKLNALSAYWSYADTAPLPQRTRTAGASYPAEFADMAASWDPTHLDRADMVKLSAAWFGVSTRTIRRWLSAATGEPISGAGS